MNNKREEHVHHLIMYIILTADGPRASSNK